MITHGSGTDSGRLRGALSLTGADRRPVATAYAPVGPTAALAVTMAVAGFVVVLGAVLLLTDPQPVPGLEPLTQRQDAESGLYVVAFVVILPLALVVATRVADRIAAGPTSGALSALSASLAAALVISLVFARVLPGSSAAQPLIASIVWWVIAVAVLVRASAPRPWPPALRLGRLAPLAWAWTAALAAGALLAFSAIGSISALALVLGVVLLGLVLGAHARRGGARLPRPSRGWGLAMDALIVVVLALAIPDLVAFEPTGGGSVDAFKASVIQFHQNFLLGPVNQVLAGDAVLVDTASQYGVAPLYLLAGWFQLVPIGYGTTAFLDGILYALFFVGGYLVLRLAGVSRLLSAGALAVAVVALLYNLLYPVGGLLQHGPLRFGLPLALVLAATMEVRDPRRARSWATVQLCLVGLSAIWSLEAFAYTLITFAALTVLRVWKLPAGERLHRLAREAALMLAACAGAHIALALATVVFAGEFPDWGQYMAYLNALVVGDLADITYDFAPWSAGFPVGVAYGASAAALVLLVLRRPRIAREEPVAVTALTGVTAYGIALFTYFVNRSADDILPYVSFPAVLAGALWLSLLLRGALTESRPARLGGLTFAMSVAVLVLAIAWSSIGERFPHTPLAHAAPGGTSLGAAFERLWDPPPIDSRAPQGELLLDRYFPGERRVPVVVSSDLGTEVLMRSSRANRLPFGDPTEDFFVEAPSKEAMQRAVAELSTGDRMLIEESGPPVLAALQREPERDLTADPVPVASPYALTPQQQWILGEVSERFRLRVIHRDTQGFLVVELAPRG